VKRLTPDEGKEAGSSHAKKGEACKEKQRLFEEKAKGMIRARREAAFSRGGARGDTCAEHRFRVSRETEAETGGTVVSSIIKRKNCARRQSPDAGGRARKKAVRAHMEAVAHQSHSPGRNLATYLL